MVATLVRQFNVPLETIWGLTRAQVQAFYFCEVDREGNVIDAEAQAETPSAEERWRDIFRRRGLPEHRIDAELRRLDNGAARGK